MFCFRVNITVLLLRETVRDSLRDPVRDPVRDLETVRVTLLGFFISMGENLGTGPDDAVFLEEEEVVGIFLFSCGGGVNDILFLSYNYNIYY
jgi:hypothetical protein